LGRAEDQSRREDAEPRLSLLNCRASAVIGSSIRGDRRTKRNFHPSDSEFAEKLRQILASA